MSGLEENRAASDLEPEAYPSSFYAWYVLALLTLAFVFSFIDRQILNLLVNPIQRDLGIGEKEMSLLMGASFAVFYTLLGIPLGRLADIWSRRWLIVWGIAFWSLMTACCGLTQKFWQLALARMGVGVGEASLSPAAYSLIADYFPPERRSTAMGVYGMGIYIGMGMALVLGGLVIKFTATQDDVIVPVLGAIRSWKLVFFIVGLPGLLVALLLLTISEPVRQGVRKKSVGGDSTVVAAPSLGQVFAYILANRGTFAFLYFALAMTALEGYGSAAWIPTFFVRRYDWSPGDTGLAFGLLVGIFGTAGIVAGGRLADLLHHRGIRDANLRVALAGIAAWLPFGALFPLMTSGRGAAVVLAPALFFGSMPFGLAPAAIQQLLPNKMRGQASAIYLFVINLIGLGLGPTIIALLTEDVFQDKKAIHLSLLIVGVAAHISATLLLWLALPYYRRSLDYLGASTSRKA